MDTAHKTNMELGIGKGLKSVAVLERERERERERVRASERERESEMSEMSERERERKTELKKEQTTKQNERQGRIREEGHGRDGEEELIHESCRRPWSPASRALAAGCFWRAAPVASPKFAHRMGAPFSPPHSLCG